MAINYVIFKVPGGRELEWKSQNYLREELLIEEVRKAVHDRTAEIVHTGPYDKEEFEKNLDYKNGYTTFVMFKLAGIKDFDNLNAIWEYMADYADISNWPERLDHSYTAQLLRFNFLNF